MSINCTNEGSVYIIQTSGNSMDKKYSQRLGHTGDLIAKTSEITINNCDGLRAGKYM